ncbi:MAG TPA: hypothetical protein DDZ81_11125 [Acetobacteraceae bacterium]|jgi:hypothetical protein|nr:hypothetical protein [Acetobacteraceae bacterium]
MTTANPQHTTPRKLNKLQRDVRATLESVGLAGLDLRVGETPILEIPADDLRRLARRLMNPLGADSRPARKVVGPDTPGPNRAALVESARLACLDRGVVWVRGNVVSRFGKMALRDMADDDLQTIVAEAAGLSGSSAGFPQI